MAKTIEIFAQSEANDTCIGCVFAEGGTVGGIDCDATEYRLGINCRDEKVIFVLKSPTVKSVTVEVDRDPMTEADLVMAFRNFVAHRDNSRDEEAYRTLREEASDVLQQLAKDLGITVDFSDLLER